MLTTTIIVVAFHSDDWIRACITSLAKASKKKKHLVVVDNSGNSLLSEQNYDAFDCEIIATPFPMGFAEANNYALVHASRLEDCVLFLNQDTKSTRGWLDACLAIMHENPGLAILSPKIRNYENDSWDPNFISCLSDEQISRLDALKGHGFDIVPRVPAPAMIVRSKMLMKVGPFDPIYGSYYEDYDLCLRVARAGGEIGYSNRAVILHYSGSASNTDGRRRLKSKQAIRNRIIYTARSQAGTRIPYLVRMLTYDFIRRLIRAVLGRKQAQPVLVILSAYYDLLAISGRLLFRRRDKKMWIDYLDSISWHSVGCNR